MISDRIEQLQKELREEERKMSQCKHTFTPPVYDAEIRKVGYGNRFVQLGSDSYTDFDGFEDKEFPRWSRKCSKCGFKEYTSKKIAIVSSYEPDFRK